MNRSASTLVSGVGAAEIRLKRIAAPLVGTISLILFLGIAEYILSTFAPIPDPYQSYKHRELNHYIRATFPANFRMITEAEPGLPGLEGQRQFSTNNMGFRGEHLHHPKPANEIRVFLVGGSTTECFYLDDSEAIDRVLQNELNQFRGGATRVKVYNAGRSGEALDDHLSMIVHRILHLQPDIIVVFSGVNDLTKSIYGFDYLHYSIERGNSFSLSTLLKFIGTEFQIARRVHSLFHRTGSQSERQILENITQVSNYKEKVALRRAAKTTDDKPRLDLEPYERNLKSIMGTAKGHNVKLVLITQPSTWNGQDGKSKSWQWMLYRNGVTYREDHMDAAMESLNRVVRQTATQQNIPVYDAAALMPKTSAFIYDDVHLNVRGAQFIGKGLANLMREKGLIPDA